MAITLIFLLVIGIIGLLLFTFADTETVADVKKASVLHMDTEKIVEGRFRSYDFGKVKMNTEKTRFYIPLNLIRDMKPENTTDLIFDIIGTVERHYQVKVYNWKIQNSGRDVRYMQIWGLWLDGRQNAP